MADQAFSVNSLNKCFIKSDFLHIPPAPPPAYRDPKVRRAMVEDAVKAAENNFGGLNPIEAFHLKKKPAYRIKKLEWELVVRQLNKNLSRHVKSRSQSRRASTAMLLNMLREGTPYKVTRTDIKSFYESINTEALEKKVLALPGLSPLSKSLFLSVSSHYLGLGGQGIPRGLAISSVLADLYLKDFDDKFLNSPEVLFYARYVDDIVVMTSGKESRNYIRRLIRTALPDELEINFDKTQTISVPLSKSRRAGTSKDSLGVIEFLGYSYEISSPTGGRAKGVYRDVTVNIASTKIKKIKSRVSRALRDYYLHGDFDRLNRRLRFLTCNFSLRDHKKPGQRKLAGIYYSYPLLSNNAASLVELDTFLRKMVFSGNSRLTRRTRLSLSSTQKRELARYSFVKGHQQKTFIHHSPAVIKDLQECWAYE